MELGLIRRKISFGNEQTLLVGEAKLKLTKLKAEHALSELAANTQNMPFAAQYRKVLCRLFVAEQARSDQVSIDRAEASS